MVVIHVFLGVSKTYPGGTIPLLRISMVTFQKYQLQLKSEGYSLQGIVFGLPKNLYHPLFFGGIISPTKCLGNSPFQIPYGICRDTSIAKEDLFVEMSDREYWKGVVNSISDEAAK